MDKISQDGDRDFSIELTSNKHLTRLTTVANGANAGVLIEGTLGKMLHALFVEPEILEVKGTYGVLRLNVRNNEITTKALGGETE